MIVEVILIHNSNIKNNKIKKEKTLLQLACMMKDRGTPARPAPHPLQQLSPQRPPGRKRIRVSEAMSTLKIQKAANENLPALYGKFSLGFVQKEGKTEEIGAPDPDPHE